MLINQFKIFDLLSITLFTLPILGLWYFLSNKMYGGYRHTLQDSLVKNKSNTDHEVVKTYTLDSVLEKEVASSAEEKVIYGLKLMEKLEPALFEASILRLAENSTKKLSSLPSKKFRSLDTDLKPKPRYRVWPSRQLMRLRVISCLSLWTS